MKFFFVLCCAILAAASNYPAPPPKSSQQTPCSQRQDLNWVRQNAENLLYLEHMRRQASRDDEWQSQMESNEYQTRLNELRSINVGCGMPPMEETPACGESIPCGYNGCNSNCEIYGQKIAAFQAELNRQRLMIQRLYAQVLSYSQNSNSCGCKICFRFLPSFSSNFIIRSSR